MFSKKQIIILLILLVVLAGALFLYKEKFQRWPWQKFSGLVSPTATPEATSDVSASPSPSVLPAEKEPREIVMEDAAKRISELSPEGAVLGGKWFATRFWFIDGSNNTFYVEYEDGHILRRLLLTANLSQMPGISYQVDAFFEPGESDWILKSGKDQKSGLPLILFSYDEAQKRWIQKN